MPQLSEASAAQVAQLCPIEIVPNTLIRIEIGGVVRKGLETDALGVSLFHNLLVPLVCPTDLLIYSPADGSQQAKNAGRMIADSASILDQLGHATSVSQIAKKAVVIGLFAEQLGNFGQLILGQAKLEPGGRIAHQILLALLPGYLHPLAYRCGGRLRWLLRYLFAANLGA